jgi:colicin import membrane protein
MNGAVMDASASCTGDVIFNQSAENAVRKSSPLPIPSDRDLVLREFKSITFNIHR